MMRLQLLLRHPLSFVTVLSFLALQSVCAQESTFESAREAVGNMRIGWNLGNTLDSNSGDTLNMWIEHWTDRSPAAYEKAWGQTVVKPELMKMFKEAGFNAIRVPVTWYPHMEAKFRFSSSSNSIWYPYKDDIGYKVQTAWMQRVKEVVDYVIGQGMYCILNVHHDTGASNTAWLIADEATYASRHERFEALWQQIAETFRDYDEHLLFEAYNEMLDGDRSWCFASFASAGNYNAAKAKAAYTAINGYAQGFVNTVRATGGNNAQRNLIVSTYGACNGGGSWSSHLLDPLKQMKLPEDETQGHLIFEVHSYPDVSNLATAKKELDVNIRDLNEYLVRKGAPVIFGEWGTSTENAYADKRSNLLAFARYFVEQTKANGMGTFYWMGLSDGADRDKPAFTQPDIVDAIVKGYYGDGGYVDGIQPASATAVREGYIYDLQGRIAGNDKCRKGTLPKGMYIVGGKKVLVR